MPSESSASSADATRAGTDQHKYTDAVSIQTQVSDPKSKKTKKSKKQLAKEAEAEELRLEAEKFAGLPENEAQILRAQIQVKPKKINYFDLFRFATKFDIFVVILGIFASIVQGAALPMFTLVFGKLTNEFQSFLTSPDPDARAFQSSIDHNSLYYLYLGIGMLVFAFLQTYILIDRGEVITARIRKHYLRAVLRQNIGYFDKLGAGEVTTRITNDTNAIQDGISEKVGLIVSGFATFITAFVIGFAKYWLLTLIMTSVVAGIIINMGVGSVFLIKYDTLYNKIYNVGASVAEETFSAVRNTVAFGTEKRMVDKFAGHVHKAMGHGINRGKATAVMFALMWFVIFQSYALAFWEGSRLIVSKNISVGTIVTIVMAMIIGAFQLGNVAPCFEAIGKAIAAGQKIYEAIDRVPSIDSLSDNGEKLDHVEGRIELNHVKFIYPSRPDVVVLPDMSLTIEPGQTVALVGMSGSGKSTIVGILERFYDPVGGTVKLDGVDIGSLNVRWLRQQVALVSQEPTLFAVSIYENICYGLIGTEYENVSEEKKRDLVIDACKQANAYDFIMSMTDGLDTNVGDRGFLMSGGQKQRIAIARAIISNPKILLLDEATSALDTKSEGIVQDALDKAAKSRTTIVIAHRLSTIKDADKIVVMSKGIILESGTHHELLANPEGAYSKLVEAQTIAPGIEENEESSGQHSRDENEPQGFYEDKIADLERSQTTKSVSSKILADQQLSSKDTTKKRNLLQLIMFLARFNKGDYTYIGIGFLASIFSGIGYPALAILYGRIISSLFVTPEGYPHMRHEIDVFSGYLFMVGAIMLLTIACMIGCLSYASEQLVRKIRLRTFQHFLSMDIAFFDEDKNSPGFLTATLAKDAQSVSGLGGATLGQIQQSVVTLVAGIIVGIAYSWKLGLVCTATVPILVGCGFLRFWVITSMQERAKNVYEASGSYACESVSAVRTVSALTRENGVYEQYSQSVEGQVKKSRAGAIRSSFLYACSQGLIPWVMGLGFWYGATLIRQYKLTSNAFFVAFVAVIFGAQAAGAIFSFAPAMGKAHSAVENIASIFDVDSQINANSDEGIHLVSEEVKGDIEFKDVHFRYPTRPQVPVLRGLNLKVVKGQYVALVGASGCGKSTTISLIESFYRPLSGEIILDEKYDLRDLNVSSFRRQVALVQQEPILYSGTISENIKLGHPDDNVSDELMYQAAKKANIHDFIMSLPDGYNTFCGSKGALLSGGQKQRIAIARALIREPKILLLDEATSALDSESEKVVQQALDEAAKGRTTIAVAHRLSTIQKADVIYVFDGGRVVEQGTHNSLMSLGGRYFELVRLQSLNN